jgi:hypothetical protein
MKMKSCMDTLLMQWFGIRPLISYHCEWLFTVGWQLLTLFFKI